MPQRGSGAPATRGRRSASLALLLVLGLIAGSSGAGTEAKNEIHAQAPQAVDSSRRHLFYLHGAWIERYGLDRPHPRYGPYRYAAIVREFAKRDFVVISEARRGEIDESAYAEKVATQVRHLLVAGVPPSHITVIGHSKGGYIALLAASVLQEPGVNFVIMAGCGRPGGGFRQGYERFLEQRAARLRGRMLSLYDASDPVAGSCSEAFARAAIPQSGEIVLKTGRGHALFYTPSAVWVDEVVQWAQPGS